MNLSQWRNPNARDRSNRPDRLPAPRPDAHGVVYREGKQWEPPKREKSGVIAPRTWRQQMARDILKANEEAAR